MTCACCVTKASRAARPAAVNGLKNRVTVWSSKPRLTGVTYAEMSAWLTSVMVVNSALKTEMPTLDPMLRERLKMLAPSARSSGESVDKVTALMGTKRTPKPAPCTNPVMIISCAETSGVHLVMT
jgi:hypothetical protein